jgi:hypothetical protein
LTIKIAFAGTQLYGQTGFASRFLTRVETRRADPKVMQVEEGGFEYAREPHTPQSL